MPGYSTYLFMPDIMNSISTAFTSENTPSTLTFLFGITVAAILIYLLTRVVSNVLGYIFSAVCVIACFIFLYAMFTGDANVTPSTDANNILDYMANVVQTSLNRGIELFNNSLHFTSQATDHQWQGAEQEGLFNYWR